MSNEVEVKVRPPIELQIATGSNCSFFPTEVDCCYVDAPSVWNGVTSASERLLLFVYDLGSFAKTHNDWTSDAGQQRSGRGLWRIVENTLRP